jgi:hypothetical protein
MDTNEYSGYTDLTTSSNYFEMKDADASSREEEI